MLLLLSITAAIVLIKTLDINQFKGQIIEQVSLNLGRKVDIEKISYQFSFSKGVAFVVKGFSIADDPFFGQENLLDVKSIVLEADVLALLKDRKIIIKKVELIAPKINIIRARDSQINVLKLNDNLQEKLKKPEQTKSSNNNIKDKPKNDLISTLTVKSFSIKDGLVIFVDDNIQNPLKVSLKDIDLIVPEFSYNNKFNFSLNASAFSDIQNIALQGFGMLSSANVLEIEQMKIGTNLNDINIKYIYEAIPLLRKMDILEKINGNFSAGIEKIVLGGSEQMKLLATGELKNGNIVTKIIPISFENIEAKFALDENEFRLNDFFAFLGSGKIVARAALKNYLKEPEYSFRGDLQEILLRELVPLNVLPVNLEGKLSAKIDGSGSLKSADILNLMTADITLDIIEGKIKDINILKIVLDKISIIPNLSERIENNLPEQYKAKLYKKDTDISEVKVLSSLAQSVIELNTIDVKAEGFNLLAQGRMNLQQNITLSSEIFIPQEISASMISAVEEFSYLANENKQIQIPLRPYNGNVREFVTYPDIEKIGKKVIKEKGKEELKNVIFKALDIETQNEDSNKADGNETPSENTEEPSIEEKLIGGILDKILK